MSLLEVLLVIILAPFALAATFFSVCVVIGAVKGIIKTKNLKK